MQNKPVFTMQDIKAISDLLDHWLDTSTDENIRIDYLADKVYSILDNN